mgnify:CR=1 FL=1
MKLDVGILTMQSGSLVNTVEQICSLVPLYRGVFVKF